MDELAVEYGHKCYQWKSSRHQLLPRQAIMEELAVNTITIDRQATVHELAVNIITIA